MAQKNFHRHIETHVGIMVLLTLLTISVGGLVQIVPLFTIESTIEPVGEVRPYSPLELAGFNIYVREGCYACHSQQIRPFRDENERYGHYSLAAESMYDHPFQWGSKRTGPDLARVGGKYSDEWHVAHLIDPRSVVPESIMPDFAFLMRPLDTRLTADHMRTLRTLGVPYTDEMIEHAVADLKTQRDPDADTDGLLTRYPKAVVSWFTGEREVTEMDALVAYLQMLGTLVDFTAYRPEELQR